MANAEPLHFQRVFVALVIAAQLCLTVWLSAILNARFDEIYSLHTSAQGFVYAIHQAIAWELQPPFYFAALELWRHLGSSILVARLLSVVAVASGVYVCDQLAGLCLPDRARPWFVVAVAFNPFVVASAVDARVYGFVFLWSALMLWLFWRGYLGAAPSAGARGFLALVSLAAIYTQYYLGFLLVGFACVLLWRRDWRLLAHLAAWSLAVGIAVIPLMLGLASEIQTNAANYSSPSGVVANAVTFIQVLLADAIPIDWSPFQDATVALVGAMLVVLVLTSDRRALAAWVAVPFAIFAGGGAAFIIAVSAVHAQVTAHYVSAFHVLAFVLVFAVFGAAAMPNRNAWLTTAASLLLLSSAASLVADYHWLAKPGDAKHVAAYIEAREAPDERIGVFDAESALPLAYYYHGVNQIVPIPRPVRFDRFLLSDLAIRNSADIATALEYRAGRHQKVWLVTADPAQEQIDLHEAMLEDFVARHYATLSDQGFYKARVRLLEER